jgi:DNA-damage-inducible protein J
VLSYFVAQSRSYNMNAVVRARIDEKVKKQAAKVLSAVGLTMSDAFRMMVMRIAAEKKLPFEPLVPNAKTIAAMRAVERGNVKKFKNVKDLMADLND